MYLKQIQVGGLDSNFSYFIGDENTKEIAIVDPINLKMLDEIVEEENLHVKALLLTHGHEDHIGDALEFQEKYGAMIYKHPLNPLETANSFPLIDGFEIEIGSTKIQVMFTPGHTPDSVCYLTEGKLLTGDTLFVGGCGRCDLEGGDVDKLYDSLINRIGNLADETEIYPGHDYGDTPFSTLRNEKATNRFYLIRDIEEFRKIRIP